MRRVLWTSVILNVILLVGLVYLSFRPCDISCAPSIYDNEYRGVTIGYAKMLISTYREKQWNYLRQNGFQPDPNTANFIDARSTWFSLKKMKSFIDKIEKLSCGSCGPILNPGINIYYAAYPDYNAQKKQWIGGNVDELNGVPIEYANQHSVVMVPTYELNGINVDFDPLHRDKNCEFSSLDSIPNSELSLIYAPTSITNIVPIANHGGNWPTRNQVSPLNVTGPITVQTAGATAAKESDETSIQPPETTVSHQ